MQVFAYGITDSHSINYILYIITPYPTDLKNKFKLAIATFCVLDDFLLFLFFFL